MYMDKLFKKYEYFIVVLYAIILVGGIDLLTNPIDIMAEGYSKSDLQFYIDMSRHGILNNPNTVSPFAYRFVTPLLARYISDALSVDLQMSYAMIAYVGITANLILVYILAKRFNDNWLDRMFVVTIVAFTMYTLKFLMFNPYSDDTLGYPLLMLAVLFYLSKRYVLVLAVCYTGLFVREFLAIPVVLVSLDFLRDYLKTRNMSDIIRAAFPILILGALIIASRLLIPVHKSYQFIDPFVKNPGTSKNLMAFLFWRRDINILLAFVGNYMPVFLLWALTGSRGQLKKVLTDNSYWVVPLFGLDMLLTLYGGTNVGIFIMYTLPIIVMCLATVSKGSSALQKTAVIVSTAYLNNVFTEVPAHDRQKFLDWFRYWNQRIVPQVVKSHVVFISTGIFIRIISVRHLSKRKYLSRNT